MRAWILGVWGAAACVAGWAGAGAAENRGQPASLTDALAVIKSHRFVDLTHAFAPGIPHWKGAPNERVKTLYTVPKDGFQINEYCHIGQWGTHVDPPAHFHEGMHTVDQIDPQDMLMPLVVIDVHEKVAKNPDYVLSLEDVSAWEKRHGVIPKGAFVAMRTDWSKRWPDDAALANRDAAAFFTIQAGARRSCSCSTRTWHHRIRPRDDGYRSGARDHQGRLFARILHPRPQSLPDRAAGEPRSGAGGGRVWYGSPFPRSSTAPAFRRA